MAMSEKATAARRKYQKAWREKNRDHINEYRRLWVHRNTDRILTANERYWEKKAADNPAEGIEVESPADGLEIESPAEGINIPNPATL